MASGEWCMPYGGAGEGVVGGVKGQNRETVVLAVVVGLALRKRQVRKQEPGVGGRRERERVVRRSMHSQSYRYYYALVQSGNSGTIPSLEPSALVSGLWPLAVSLAPDSLRIRSATQRPNASASPISLQSGRSSRVQSPKTIPPLPPSLLPSFPPSLLVSLSPTLPHTPLHHHPPRLCPLAPLHRPESPGRRIGVRKPDQCPTPLATFVLSQEVFAGSCRRGVSSFFLPPLPGCLAARHFFSRPVAPTRFLPRVIP